MYRVIVLFGKTGDEFDVNTNISYTKEEAVAIVSLLRKKGWNAELYPEEYANPTVTQQEAYEIALKKYNIEKEKRPENYDELLIDEVFNPIYYGFYCTDYAKVREGMAPGYFGIEVDKLTGNILSNEKVREYRKLNYSFL